MARKISFITLGCSKNEVDTVHMKERLIEAGYTIVEPDMPCDAIVVNTCSFLREAIEENLEVIFDVAHLPAVESGVTKLVVAGCLPSRYGRELQQELTEPDRFVPCVQEENIVQVFEELFDEPAEHSDKKLVLPSSPSAYVKISDGCNRFCSFCTIPFIRGRYKSYPREEIVAEVDGLVANGVKECVLVAQDTGLWGADLNKEDSFPLLLKQLARRHPDTWFRIMYLQPSSLSDQLLSVMEDHDNICNYLDIPLQHSNRVLLRSMNRRGSRAEFLSMLYNIRQRITDIAIRTTLIVGYPGEGEREFKRLCDFVSDAEFDYVGIFPYSREEGTRAASLPNQVPEEVKLERFQKLRDIADSVSSRRIKRRIGQHEDILILGTEDGRTYGRSQYQAPDVDGITFIHAGSVGDFVHGTITDTLLYEMEAELVL